MIVTVLLFIVLLVIFVSFTIKRPRHFPPGPAWLPIVGNGPQVKRLSKKLGGLHLALFELSKQWNTNVLGLKLGNELVVTVFTYPLIKRILCCEDYDARPTNFFIKLRCLGSIKGITCTNGEFWHTQRNFLINNLRNLGFGKKTTEQYVHEEVKGIISDIDENRDIKVGKLIAPAVISVLWSLLTGSGLSRKDDRLIKLLNLFQRRSRLFDMSGGVIAQYPWLRFVAPEKTGYNLILQINNDLKDLFMQAIQEHHQTWRKGMDTDFIYSYIAEMKKESAHYSFSNDQLLMVCLDLFIAGAQTTSSTLDFAFLMMMQYPFIQQKVQKLIDEEFQNDLLPVNYSDRHKLPFVEAVLFEVERYRTITPVIGPRRVLKDTVLEGYVIPKNTTILIHTYSVHMNPERWDDPKSFKPDRFLTADGKLTYCEEFIPFGLGKRRCLGESLARSCIFIFFTEILRNYSIIPKPGTEMLEDDYLPGITLSAEYSARFVKRRGT